MSAVGAINTNELLAIVVIVGFLLCFSTFQCLFDVFSCLRLPRWFSFRAASSTFNSLLPIAFI